MAGGGAAYQQQHLGAWASAALKMDWLA